MKIRNGFVSNSSSSSFIVAVPEDRLEEEIEVVIKLRLYDFEDGILRTPKEVEKYYTEQCAWENGKIDPDYMEEYNKCLVELEKGKAILVGCVTNENGALEEYICENGLNALKLPPEYTIIQGKGGF